MSARPLWARLCAVLQLAPPSAPVLAAGLVLSLVAGAVSQRWAQEEAHHMLADHFRFTRIAINQRIRAYTHALDGLQGLLAGGGPMDAARFRRYVERFELLRHYPGVRAVAFARPVPEAAGTERLAIAFAEAVPGYARPPGLGLPAQRLYAAVRREARGPGKAILLRAAGAPGESADFVLALPVVRAPAEGRALAHGRPDLVGVVCALLHAPAIFRLSDLLDPVTLEHVRLRVIDAGRAPSQTRRVIFDSRPQASPRGALAGKPASRDARTLSFDFGGRNLELELTSSNGFVHDLDAVFPWVVFLGGIVTTLLLAAVVGSLSASRRRAERLAERMTGELRESQETLLAAQHMARIGNWSYDLAARRQQWSEELYRVLGRDPRRGPAGYLEMMRRVHPGERRAMRAMVRASLLDGHGYEIDLRVRAFDGEARWVHVVGLPMVSESAQVVLVRGTAMDITERKRVELRKAAEHRVIRLLSGARSLGEVMPALIETLCATFGWACGVHWVWRPGALVCATSWTGGDPALEAYANSIRNGRPSALLPEAIRAGRAVSSAELAGGERLDLGPDAAVAGLRGGIALPVLAAEELAGGLELFSREESAIDEELLAALHAIGAHIGQYCERKQAEEALRLSEERLHGIVSSAVEAIVTVDENHRIVLFNPAAEKMFACTARDALGGTIDRFLPQRLHDVHAAHMRRFEVSGESMRRMGESMLVTALRADGEEFPVEASISKMTQGGKRLYTVIMNDITARRRNEEQLQFLANYDPLTSLPNRSLFNQKLQRALGHAQRFNRKLAVLFVDLDRFKNINDTLGHEAGDEMLREVAARLVGSLRETDTVARLGGDEFVVLIDEVAQMRDVDAVAQKLINTVSVPFVLRGHEYHITASIGISTYPAEGRDGPTLLKNADIAMYRAKEQGKNNYQFYSARMNVHSVERLSLEANLRRALERDEFLLHYQPKVELATGRITGLEALVRWRRPDGGMVAPAQFIPIAEETGLIVAIGDWVLRTACERGRVWQERGLPPVRIAVNLSARQFTRANLAQEVAQALETAGLPGSCLELEITESMVMANPEQSVRILRELKSMGISLSIDDFGTGYSSLAYLKRFPIDCIKVDRSFIQDIPGDADDAVITRTIIAMARSLRLKVVAEGVENEAQLEFLREHGCDEMQGYYFSKPVDENAVLALYRARREIAAPAARRRVEVYEP